MVCNAVQLNSITDCSLQKDHTAFPKQREQRLNTIIFREVGLIAGLLYWSIIGRLGVPGKIGGFAAFCTRIFSTPFAPA